MLFVPVPPLCFFDLGKLQNYVIRAWVLDYNVEYTGSAINGIGDFYDDKLLFDSAYTDSLGNKLINPQAFITSIKSHCFVGSTTRTSNSLAGLLRIMVHKWTSHKYFLPCNSNKGRSTNPHIFLVYALILLGKMYPSGERRGVYLYIAFLTYILSYGLLISISLSNHSFHLLSQYPILLMIGQLAFYLMMYYYSITDFSWRFYLTEINENYLEAVV